MAIISDSPIAESTEIPTPTQSQNRTCSQCRSPTRPRARRCRHRDEMIGDPPIDRPRVDEPRPRAGASVNVSIVPNVFDATTNRVDAGSDSASTATCRCHRRSTRTSSGCRRGGTHGAPGMPLPAQVGGFDADVHDMADRTLAFARARQMTPSRRAPGGRGGRRSLRRSRTSCRRHAQRDVPDGAVPVTLMCSPANMASNVPGHPMTRPARAGRRAPSRRRRPSTSRYAGRARW